MAFEATFPLKDIGLLTDIIIGKSDFNVALNDIPKQYVNGAIYSGKKLRCTLQYGRKVNRGGYGSIYRCSRTPSVGKDVCVKTPHNPAHSMCPEAILQSIACHTLEVAGIVGAIPHIYDIFQYAGETRFCMEYIEGMNVVDAVLKATDPDTVWMQILGQVSLILGFLEENIQLDHRDLKADNLWVRPTPVDYSITLGGVTWHIEAPFQVVILDFGFACLGENGNAVVSLSDGILPAIDPCPKEGRDLFQLIASMWSIPSVRERAGEAVTLEMNSLLDSKGKSYMELVHKTLDVHWIYLAVSNPTFQYPSLHPIALLQKLSRDWSDVGIHTK